MFVGFAIKIKVSEILKMLKWSDQLTKQNWLVCELVQEGATIQQVLILKFAFGPEKLSCLWRNARQQFPCRF